MPNDLASVRERLAVRLIREFEEVAHVKRLEPGDAPTADWRLTTADGRVADVEVTEDTNEDARKFEKVFGVVCDDEATLRRRYKRRPWSDSRLKFVWDVRIHPHGLSDEKLSVKQLAEELVEALTKVLVEVEASGDEPEEMKEAAQSKLVEPRAHLDSCDWGTAWQEASEQGINFDNFILEWGKDTGYWYPRSLVVWFHDLPPSFRIAMAPRPKRLRCGVVRTSPGVIDVAVGEYGHLLDRVQHHIDRKTAKRQLEHAPGLRWLFVVFDDNMAAVQLDDYFGPACLELDASERCPFHVLDKLAFDYFDEVWVSGRSFQSRDHIVLRLFKTGDAPQHKVVRRAEVLAG